MGGLGSGLMPGLHCVWHHVCDFANDEPYIRLQIKNIGFVTGLGGRSSTQACNRIARLATNPSATKLFGGAYVYEASR